MNTIGLVLQCLYSLQEQREGENAPELIDVALPVLGRGGPLDAHQLPPLHQAALPLVPYVSGWVYGMVVGSYVHPPLKTHIHIQ